MPTMRSCCCGCSLRTGTQIILWIGVIFATLAIIFSIVNDIQQIIPFTITINVEYAPIVANYTVILGIHVMGICAVEVKSPAFLKPYLAFLGFIVVWMIIDAVLWAVGLIELWIYKNHILQTKGNFGINDEYLTQYVIGFVITEIIYFLVIGFTYYCFIVVLNFIEELKREISRQ